MDPGPGEPGRRVGGSDDVELVQLPELQAAGGRGRRGCMCAGERDVDGGADWTDLDGEGETREENVGRDGHGDSAGGSG